MRHNYILLIVLLSIQPAIAEEIKPKLDEIVVTASRVGELIVPPIASADLEA
ncbi:MAG: hypothetical protein GQ542_03410 [Desulforhopalus sp.]|nr:hypothetical protein [Desulforhopalus sp.]